MIQFQLQSFSVDMRVAAYFSSVGGSFNVDFDAHPSGMVREAVDGLQSGKKLVQIL